MAENDCEWVVESIVGYLGSPEWVIPVTDFMENKCTGKRLLNTHSLGYTVKLKRFCGDELLAQKRS